MTEELKTTAGSGAAAEELDATAGALGSPSTCLRRLCKERARSAELEEDADEDDDDESVEESREDRLRDRRFERPRLDFFSCFRRFFFSLRLGLGDLRFAPSLDGDERPVGEDRPLGEESGSWRCVPASGAGDAGGGGDALTTDRRLTSFAHWKEGGNTTAPGKGGA